MRRRGASSLREVRKKEEPAAGNTQHTPKNPLLSSAAGDKERQATYRGSSMGFLGVGQHVGVFLSRRVFPLLALCCFAFFATLPAGADTLLPPAYALSGSLTLTGNPACAGGSTCLETIAFSFDLGYKFLSGLDVYQAYVADLVETGTGALPFTGSSAGPILVSNADNNFIALGDADFEIDIHLAENFVPAPVAPSLLDFADLFSCETATCITDLAPSQFQGSTPPIFGLHNPSGPVVSSAALIPEPATSGLLLCGLFALGLLGAASRKLPAFRVTPSALGSR